MPESPNPALKQIKAAYVAAMSLTFSSLTYLPPAIYTPASTSSAEIFFCLAQAGTSFTFSRDIFWEHVTAHPTRLHVVLVNKTKATETGAEIGSWHRFLRQRTAQKGVEAGQKIGLLFLDWRAVQAIGANASAAPELLGAHFGGFLEMRGRSSGVGEEAWEVMPVWKRDEVMLRVEGG